ncbi:hypothetical protein DPEC_G00291630 [Dallia pectoralis]|uniref:Uncharacterized protein n=1 Tax=Dallia pectoralis TaxID=75939 RepID=A0ACC2FHQ6_DALPE|nr:hypothetical protein DPEC_G00291630 [Dallia pectoralis]
MDPDTLNIWQSSCRHLIMVSKDPDLGLIKTKRPDVGTWKAPIGVRAECRKGEHGEPRRGVSSEVTAPDYGTKPGGLSETGQSPGPGRKWAGSHASSLERCTL